MEHTLDAQANWQSVKNELCKGMTPTERGMMKNLAFKESSDDSIILTASNPTTLAWVRRKYHKVLLRLWRQVMPQVGRVVIDQREMTRERPRRNKSTLYGYQFANF